MMMNPDENKNVGTGLRPVPTFHLRSYPIHRHLIPRATFKDSARLFFLNPAPLLEEKWDPGLQGLIPNIGDPFLHQRSCSWTRLAAHDHPIDLLEIQLPKRTYQRLK